MLQQNILKLDAGGIPEGWISPRDAAKCIAEGHVAEALEVAAAWLKINKSSTLLQNFRCRCRVRTSERNTMGCKNERCRME